MRPTTLAAMAVAMTIGATTAEAVVYTNHAVTYAGAFAFAPRTYAGEPRAATVLLPQITPSTLGALGVLDNVVLNISYHIDAFASVRNNTGYEPVDNMYNGRVIDASNIFSGPGVGASIGPLLFFPVGDWTNIVINQNATLHLPVSQSGDVNTNRTVNPAYHGAYIGNDSVAVTATMASWQLTVAPSSNIAMEWFGNQSTSGMLSLTYSYRTGVEETTEVPEPFGLSLLALGGGAVAFARRRRTAPRG